MKDLITLQKDEDSSHGQRFRVSEQRWFQFLGLCGSEEKHKRMANILTATG
jgi:hypothetical protein